VVKAQAGAALRKVAAARTRLQVARASYPPLPLAEARFARSRAHARAIVAAMAIVRITGAVDLLRQPHGFEGLGPVSITPHSRDPATAQAPDDRDPLVYKETALPATPAHPDGGDHLVSRLENALDVEVDLLKGFEPGNPGVSDSLESTARPPVTPQSRNVVPLDFRVVQIGEGCQSRRR
jgi:hypothetical protein